MTLKDKVKKNLDRDPTLLKYLREIGNIPILSREEESEIASRYKETGDEKALKMLISSNLKFVVNVAKKYYGCGLSMSDLVDEGNIGLIEAAKRYDPTKNTRLITYAVWWIRQAIANAIASQSGIVRLPVKQATLAYNIKTTRQELVQKLMREPTITEISNKLGVKEIEVQRILEFAKQWIPDESSSEEFNFKNYQKSLAYNLRSINYRSSTASLKEEIQQLLKGLTLQEQKILKLRFGLENEDPMTLENVGKIMNLSRERIRQIEEIAITKIRKTFKYTAVSDILN
jgi:RNA polymerase primary sigma factor